MDFHTALYHCREIEKHFEELNDEPKEKAHRKSLNTLTCEEHLCMEPEQIQASLRELERSIEARDDDKILGFEDMIDGLVDYFDCLIIASERNDSAKQLETRIKKLKAWRESTGKLAQLLCQSND
jgi:hypothetical protein